MRERAIATPLTHAALRVRASFRGEELCMPPSTAGSDPATSCGTAQQLLAPGGRRGRNSEQGHIAVQKHDHRNMAMDSSASPGTQQSVYSVWKEILYLQGVGSPTALQHRKTCRESENDKDASLGTVHNWVWASLHREICRIHVVATRSVVIACIHGLD